MPADTLTRDITALSLAVDAGDDAVLPILADAMEEAGDSRSIGLRLVGDRMPADDRLEGMPAAFAWSWIFTDDPFYRCDIPRRLEGLAGGHYIPETPGRYAFCCHRTRSGAFLGLAAALTPKE